MEIAIFQHFITPVVLAIIGLVGIIIPLILVRNKDKKVEQAEVGKEQFKIGVRDIAKVYSIMDEVRRIIPEVNRVVVFKCHNSFAEPKPTGPLYITAMFEESAKDTFPLLNDTQRMPVDYFHVDKIILPILEKGEVSIDISQLEGNLKTFYEANNHQWSIGKKLVLQKDCLLYIVYSFRTGTPTTLGARDAHRIEVTTNKIRNIMDLYRS